MFITEAKLIKVGRRYERTKDTVWSVNLIYKVFLSVQKINL